ncbi:MAG TPA: PEGA domain-containing protein, partial [Anaeromyxobacter sp.]
PQPAIPPPAKQPEPAPTPEPTPAVAARVETPEPAPPPRVETPPPPRPHHPSKVASVSTGGSKGVRLVKSELNSIPTPPAASGDGVLAVVATPWAEVQIDGRDIGETPREVRLGAGSYRIKATHPALGMREYVVTIKPGRREVWKPTFAN